MLDNDLFEMNTSLVMAEGPSPGPGRIAGRVISANTRVESHRSYHDVPVILADAGNIPLEWVTTDEYGQFEFDGLALGTYKLYADVTSIWSQPETVIINEVSPANDTVNIRMYTSAPLSIEEPLEDIVSISGLFPNPASEKLNIKFISHTAMQLHIHIMNMTGQEVFQSYQQALKGMNDLQIPVGDFPDGIYLLSFRWDGQQQYVSKKFIKN